VVVPSLPEEYRSEQGYRRFAVEATELASRLRPSGLKLVYHNHSHELERFGRQTGLETLFAAASPDALMAELDTYWLQHGGVNPAAWIRRFKHRAPLVHLKDMAVDQGKPVDAEIGEGNLDWVEILSACRDAGTEWLVVEQDEPRRDPMESVAISYANLSKLAAEVGLEA
jgi:sugar phosphate isomerase/epimerase